MSQTKSVRADLMIIIHGIINCMLIASAIVCEFVYISRDSHLSVLTLDESKRTEEYYVFFTLNFLLFLILAVIAVVINIIQSRKNKKISAEISEKKQKVNILASIIPFILPTFMYPLMYFIVF